MCVLFSYIFTLVSELIANYNRLANNNSGMELGTTKESHVSLRMSLSFIRLITWLPKFSARQAHKCINSRFIHISSVDRLDTSCSSTSEREVVSHRPTVSLFFQSKFWIWNWLKKMWTLVQIQHCRLNFPTLWSKYVNMLSVNMISRI